MKKQILKVLVIGFILSLVVYIFGAIVTFDFSENAYPLDEQYYPNGRIVILGPKPRGALCRAALADIHYVGDEWPFLLYYPICSLWKAREKHSDPRPSPMTTNSSDVAK
jgi:hypothetical protein